MLLLPFYLTGAAGAAAVLCAGTRGPLTVLWVLLAFAGGFVAGIVLAVALLGVLSMFWDPNKSTQRQDPIWAVLSCYAYGTICAVARVRFHAVGLEKLPEGSWLLVCNHRSAFDPLTASWLLRKKHLAFIAKQTIFRIPIARRVIPSLCYLALDREDDRAALRTILKAVELLRSGAVSFCIYPEGTRNKGEGLLPFRNGAFKIAQKAKVPIVVSRIEGTDRVHRNFPWRHTDVTFTICGVLDAQTLQQMKTNEIGERVRQCIDSVSC